MKILVFANDIAWNELTANSTGVEWIRTDDPVSFSNRQDIDAYFYLSGNYTYEIDNAFHSRPVFINSVSTTLREISAAENMIRINGWNGFLKRDCWEIAGEINDEYIAVLKTLKKNFIIVPDEPGFISARIIAMIINEAFFAKAENVSTEKEIDIAMKLGTNYPYGPFEWAEKIGLKQVYELLVTLSKNDSRYKPAFLLEQEAMKK